MRRVWHSGCTKQRQVLLDKIEQYKDSEPEMVKYLQWYVERTWDDQVRDDTYRQDLRDLGDEEYEKRTVAALRAMADKIEQKGMHFIIGAELPKLPIFSGDDHIERYMAHIKVTIVAGPLGG